jgi:FMN phosphatase YigB (HAD superfamily)
MPCLVLDAMGVIFEAADDVAELLIPFIAEKSGCRDESTIQIAYIEASLGTISADEFWNRVGVSAEHEDEYLSRHSLNSGVIELLVSAQRHDTPVWCLSNDIGRWSQKLRERFNLERYLQGSVISGDVGMRKPDSAIYQALLRASGYAVDALLFVDDRAKNVRAARTLGIETMLFDSQTGFNQVKTWLSR